MFGFGLQRIQLLVLQIAAWRVFLWIGLCSKCRPLVSHLFLLPSKYLQCGACSIIELERQIKKSPFIEFALPCTCCTLNMHNVHMLHKPCIYLAFYGVAHTQHVFKTLSCTNLAKCTSAHVLPCKVVSCGFLRAFITSGITPEKMTQPWDSDQCSAGISRWCIISFFVRSSQGAQRGEIYSLRVI